MESIDITIIGGGCNGLATGLALAEEYPEKTIAIFEKQKFLGEEQSGHNSGVKHSGMFYHPGSLKAKLCVRGNELLSQFAQEHGVASKNVGKLTLAASLEDLPKLAELEERARKNKVPWFRRLTREEIKEYEPNVDAVAAIYTPTTGIVNAAEYVNKLESLVNGTQGMILKRARVTNVTADKERFIVTVNQEEEEYQFESGMVINAAGLFADEVGRMVNPDFPYQIKPLKGEYMKFSKKARSDVYVRELNVYPVPKDISGMFDQWGKPKEMSGVHLTSIFEYDAQGRAVVGNAVLVGPLSHVVKDKKDYRHEHTDPRDYHRDIVKLFPNLCVEDLEFDQVGIQAKLVGYDDFVIERDKKYRNAIHLIADSPGFTSSLAIAEYMVGLVKDEKGK